MDENEQWMRSKFDWAIVKPAEPYMGLRRDQWYWRLPVSQSPTGSDTEAEAWAAARAFTEDRLKQIEDKQGEVNFIQEKMDEAEPEDKPIDPEYWICERILKSLQAHLEQLQRGMVKR